MDDSKITKLGVSSDQYKEVGTEVNKAINQREDLISQITGINERSSTGYSLINLANETLATVFPALLGNEFPLDRVAQNTIKEAAGTILVANAKEALLQERSNIDVENMDFKVEAIQILSQRKFVNIDTGKQFLAVKLSAKVKASERRDWKSSFSGSSEAYIYSAPKNLWVIVDADKLFSEK